LLFHFALRFTHLELFWASVLIPCAPLVGVLGFFLLECQQFASEMNWLETLPW
jgi:hypothetical protein